MPGKPKSRLPIKANAAGKKVNIRYLNIVMRLLTIIKSPPSRTQTESLGYLLTKLSQSCLIFCIFFTPFQGWLYSLAYMIAQTAKKWKSFFEKIFLFTNKILFFQPKKLSKKQKKTPQKHKKESAFFVSKEVVFCLIWHQKALIFCPF